MVLLRNKCGHLSVIVVHFYIQVRAVHRSNIWLAHEHQRKEDVGGDVGRWRCNKEPIVETVFTVDDARDLIVVRVLGGMGTYFPDRRNRIDDMS